MNVDDIKNLIDAEVKAQCYEAGQMTFGQFVTALQSMPQDDHIMFDFAGLSPTGFDSYRGYYNHIAVNFEGRSSQSVGNLLEKATECAKETLTGYRGGNYNPPHDNRPMWADNYGCSGGTRIVKVEKVGWRVLIRTVTDED